MKRVLIISPHWPPCASPDMQRARMSLPYFRENGWEPVVLCVGDPWVGGVKEPELLGTVPSDIEIHPTRALSLRWTRLIGLTNIGLRSWIFLLFAGRRLIREKRIDLIFFTNTQFVTFTLGRLWRLGTGVPLVFDFQDPWRTDYYQRPGSRPPPGGWKYQVARAMASLLEGWSLKRASGIISVSPDYIRDLKTRYPWLERIPAEVIRFGASRADLDQALRLPASAHSLDRAGNLVHVVYTGAAGPIVPHAVEFLFTSLRELREKDAAVASRLRFHFIGTSYAAAGAAVSSILPLATRYGVADQVTEVPHRIGHLEAIRLQKEADVLLIAGSSDPAYSPSKLYPYFLSGRPMIALVFRDSVLEQQVDELRCATVIRLQPAGGNIEAATTLADCLGRAAVRDFPSSQSRNESLFEREYLAGSLTGRQCKLFDRAVSQSNE